MIWIVFIALTALALFLLLRPLMSASMAVKDARSSELAVYRDQLSELEAELARGSITPTEADAARNEIKRKMLSIAQSPKANADPKRGVQSLRIAIGAGIPVLAFGIYLSIGQPDLAGLQTPSASEAQTPAANPPDIETLAARLAERLKQNPNDAQGWRMLGWSYANLDRYPEAVKAYERAVAIDGKNAALLSLYGEAIARAAGGVITPEAQMIFDRALAIDPKEPRAQLFRGLALEQQGKLREALDQWVKVIGEGKAGDEWMPALRARAIELAVKLKLDPAKMVPGADALAPVVPGAERAPSKDDAAISEMSPAEQSRLIADMVQRLEERLRRDPNDLDGWLMLARSRKTLGDVTAARAAIDRAKAIFGKDKLMLAKISQTAGQLGLD
jgi:cytochrome c-type biogenesis protein CcmH